MSSSDTETTPLPARGWTAERQVLFLERLAHHGNARAAASAVSLSVQSAYRLRRRDPLFARSWAAALLLARDTATHVLAERAIDGIEEPIYYRGELLATRRRFDTRLLLAHLGRLDRLTDEAAAGADAGRFDQLLACIAGEPVPEELEVSDDAIPPALEELEMIAAEVAADEVLQEWREKEGDPETQLDDDRYRAFQHERVVRRFEARSKMTALWDSWTARAAAKVDILIGEDDAAPLPGLPGNPFAASSDEAAGFSSGQCNPRKPAPAPLTSAPEARRTD